jgi:hypothetical protein
MIDPKDSSQLEAAAFAAQAALEEEKKKQADSGSLGDLAEGAVDIATSGVVETLGSVAGAAVEGIGTVATGAVEIVGSILSGIFDA